ICLKSTGLGPGHQRIHVYSSPGTVETHTSVDQRKNCVIAAESDIFPRQKLCAPLAHNDIAGNDRFAAEFFYTQPLADAVAAIFDAALSFFVSHCETLIVVS